MNFFPRFSCCIAALCLLSACAARQDAPLSGGGEREALSEETASILQNFRRRANEVARERDAPLFVRASLRFGKEGDSRRVTLLLWQNAPVSESLNPVRLDVQAGMGTSVAKALLDDKHFLLYAPHETRAWRYDGSEQILFLHNSFPIPLTLRDLAALASGDFTDFFNAPPSPSAARRTRTGSFIFGLSAGKRGGEVELSPEGRLLRWTNHDKSRTLEFGYDANAARPERVESRDADGNRAVLLVKEYTRPGTPYTPEQMDLKIPPGTAILPLKEMNAL